MIAVDWVYGSTGVYLFAVDNVVKLSLEISRFLSQLLVGQERFGLVVRRAQQPERKGSPLRLGAGAKPPRELVFILNLELDSWGADRQGTEPPPRSSGLHKTCHWTTTSLLTVQNLVVSPKK